MPTMPVVKLLLASALCLTAAATLAQEAPAPKQLPAAPSHDDLQSCLKETDDYVTRGKTVLYVIGLTNSCDKRLRCEIFANVTGARGTSLGHTIMTLGAAGSGPAAKQTYSMHVKSAGGMAQISRECKVL